MRQAWIQAMKIDLLLAIIVIGSMMPLASAAQAMRVGDTPGSAVVVNDAEFGTGQRRSLTIAGEAAATSSSSHTYEKGSVRAFSKSGKSKVGKSKAGKSMESQSVGDESHEPFNKSGKSKNRKSKGAKIYMSMLVDTPHKIFTKSKKGNSNKAGKSKVKSNKDGKSGNSNKAGKSGNSNKAGKSGDSNKAGKSNVDGPFHKAGKSKSYKGTIYHHESENLLHNTNADGTNNHLPNTSDNGLLNTNSTDPDSNNAPTNILAPTPQPTCNTVQDDFNLCIAIDSSGSVCNGFVGGECLGCGPSYLCKDLFVDLDTCCTNFANLKEFSSLMVTSLEEFPVEKSFSVVQFATDATVKDELSSADETLLTLDDMEYSGGWTNHASAIQKCQQTFLSTSADRKKFILLITDGVSTVPKSDPEGDAEAAATLAKEDDIAIIPIFISSTYDEDALDFMRRISSDGKVFDVTDFESLGSVQESLVDQVSCS